MNSYLFYHNFRHLSSLFAFYHVESNPGTMVPPNDNRTGGTGGQAEEDDCRRTVQLIRSVEARYLPASRICAELDQMTEGFGSIL